MPDLFYLLSKWKKQIAAVVVLSLAIVAAIYFIRPGKYLSVATALPANSYLADKSRVFSDNIEALYSVLGTADELDMIIGTGQLDTVYLSVADSFPSHYDKLPRNKMAQMLKKSTKVERSEYGELKIKVRHRNKMWAAEYANAIMQQIQELHSNLQNANNRAVLSNLLAGREKLRAQANGRSDSTGVMTEQLKQYERLIGQYQLMADSKTPALLIVENARPASQFDLPKFWQLMLATLAASFLFALLVAIVLEKRKITVA